MANNFKLRNGAGKMNSYSAMQKKGLISPMQVEEPPKKKGVDIYSMSNDMRYRLEKKGSFSPKELKAFSGHPKAKDYGAYKAGRDKDVGRRKVGDLDTMVKDQTREQKKLVNRSDQEKQYGAKDEFKSQTQKAGVAFDKQGSQIYPGQEGHTEAYLKSKAEGYGTTKDKLVKR